MEKRASKFESQLNTGKRARDSTVVSTQIEDNKIVSWLWLKKLSSQHLNK
jgi:hypothetical protein